MMPEPVSGYLSSEDVIKIMEEYPDQKWKAHELLYILYHTLEDNEPCWKCDEEEEE